MPSVALAAVTAPTNLTIFQSASTNDTTPTMSWSAPGGATWYEVAVDNSGFYSVGNVLTYTLPAQADGWHTFYLRANDNYGSLSPQVTKLFEIDTSGPTVSQVSISAVTANVSVTVSVSTSGESAVTSCSLIVDDVNVAAMSKSGTTWSVPYTFTKTSSTGTATAKVQAYCIDGDGNTALSTGKTVTINGASTSAMPGDLIKMACATVTLASDPCRAVYYYGTDGQRHAFPNETVYFTWYSSFSNIKTVTSGILAALPLGKNVTLRPGTVLMKFTTVNDVYAISKGAVLHHYLTPSLVAADYGSSWPLFLRVVPDVLRGNYAIGSVIDESTDYDPASATAAVTSIDSNF